jgi:phenylalanyl-tRNA synthetase beta chain
MPLAELEERLMMAGLNHEGTETLGEDLAIDLEVTSNRPDCLGHIGVAREIGVLYDLPLTLPEAAPLSDSTAVATLAQVSLESPELCPRYTARVIQGVRVGPSPDWLVDRLQTVYEAKKPGSWVSVNNIVDITNYVLLESGQPLHAFDLEKLAGRQIVIRAAEAKEPFLAINHKIYALDASICVIADAQRPVALGGVMGGAETEVSEQTTDLLIESAIFDPVAIRNTARKLSLHSDSSYRFERGPDPAGVDWASRRCCELILELAGGKLAEGVIDVGSPSPAREPIVLRLEQIERILGISVDRDEVVRILTALGNHPEKIETERITVVPPSWRRDLYREIDLVEEVARIHGYDKIPEDRQVPIKPSSRSLEDRVLARLNHTLTATGFDEVITPSAVDEKTSAVFSPWTDTDPIRCEVPMLRGAALLRRSLIPSLLTVRRTNENFANQRIELFEVARVYLSGSGKLPVEEKMLAIASGRDFFEVKGVIEALLDSLGVADKLMVSDVCFDLFQAGRCGQLGLGEDRLGYLGAVSEQVRKGFGLRSETVVAEISLSLLLQRARLTPQAKPLSPYPAVDRDFNFEVDETVRWSQLADTVQHAAGEYLEAVRYLETYRDRERLGEGKKSLVFKVVLRKADGTLTGEEADQVRGRIEQACGTDHGAVLRI